MLIYWLAAGVVLIVLEFVIPGGVIVFLGIAALLVCLLIWAGFVDGHMAAFTAWFILSLLLLVSLRGLVQRMMPGDQSWQSTDEDADAYGTIVEVAETIENAAEGRIHFRGSTWPATSYEHTLNKGDRARMIARDNLIWIVEPVDEDVSLDFEA